ncbi:MAG TPA: MotA/TolQ/ExbB proton channel family protein [Gammaproteobacteria bacterium]|nr:MotA/TolQ/ExbB proton channel family protein [Gammaproteobacteria bacterium]
MLPDFNTILKYYEMGGFVMPPLVVTGILLWYALSFRLVNVQRSKKGPRELIRLLKKDSIKPKTVTAKAAEFALQASKNASSRKQLKCILNEQFMHYRQEINQHRTMVRALVVIAPLLGLLGTIDGMIETFDSLGNMALFSQSGGIAGGISRALFTTQVGLAIAIPGVMIGRIVERKQNNIYRELDQIKDLVCVKKTESQE